MSISLAAMSGVEQVSCCIDRLLFRVRRSVSIVQRSPLQFRCLLRGAWQGSEQRRQKGFAAVVRLHAPHEQAPLHTGFARQIGMTSAIRRTGFPLHRPIQAVAQVFPGQTPGACHGQTQERRMAGLGRRPGYRKNAELAVPDHSCSLRQAVDRSFQQLLFADRLGAMTTSAAAKVTWSVPLPQGLYFQRRSFFDNQTSAIFGMSS
jgi:hypothetical protein